MQPTISNGSPARRTADQPPAVAPSAINDRHARGLLDRIEVLRHPSDVDLLIFFATHPRALLASDQLATLLGYEIKQIADSLDVLLKAGVLRQISNRAHAARLYVFTPDGTNEGWLPLLVKLACTREGRLAIRRALKRQPDSGEEAHDG